MAVKKAYTPKTVGEIEAIADEILEIIDTAAGPTYTTVMNQVIFNGPATILINEKQEKFVVRCDPKDTFSPTYGFLLCKFLEHTGMTHKQLHDTLQEVEEAYASQVPEKKIPSIEDITPEDIENSALVKIGSFIARIVQTNTGDCKGCYFNHIASDECGFPEQYKKNSPCMYCDIIYKDV